MTKDSSVSWASSEPFSEDAYAVCQGSTMSGFYVAQVPDKTKRDCPDFGYDRKLENALRLSP